MKIKLKGILCLLRAAKCSSPIYARLPQLPVPGSQQTPPQGDGCHPQTMGLVALQ